MRLRCLVTGAAGFLGSHLCERLLARGCEVAGVDNFVTGARRNLDGLLRHPDFRFVEADITRGLAWTPPLDRVYNFASPASPIDYLKLPIETLLVGSAGTLHALELARAKGARFLQASTSECYGDPEVHPQVETYWGNVNPVGPRSCYDEAKRYGEALTMAFHRVHGVPTRIMRIFNTYGPRMRLEDGRVVPAIVGAALRGEPLPIFGDGAQTRSFCYVDDLIEGAILLMESEEVMPVNIGNPVESTILEFAEAVRAVTGCAAPLEFHPLPQDDPKRRRPDIGKARRLLGWEPRVPLAEGLRRTLPYFRERLGAGA
jgi:dTDP-glucose 4,6-dehydratase